MDNCKSNPIIEIGLYRHVTRGKICQTYFHALGKKKRKVRVATQHTTQEFAELVELADTSDLGSDVLWRKGSSPLFGTIEALTRIL